MSAGYRDRRRKELVALAADAVAEVRDSSDRVPLAPMNPFERKIVHDAVAAAGLTQCVRGRGAAAARGRAARLTATGDGSGPSQLGSTRLRSP